MTETKHTPGPWAVVEHSWRETSIYGADHSRVASLRLGAEDEKDEDSIKEEARIVAANARLIAAAPDREALVAELVTALAPFAKTTIGVVEEDGPIFNRCEDDTVIYKTHGWPRDQSAIVRVGDIRRARSALAKAKGEAEK